MAFYTECPMCRTPDSAPVIYDARGIPLGRCCAECYPEWSKRYRPEVLDDPRYDLMGETLDEDY